MSDPKTTAAAWRQIAVLPAAGWTAGLILLVAGASYLGAAWPGRAALGVSVGLWVVLLGGAIAVIGTSRGRAGAALRDGVTRALRAGRAGLDRWQIDPLPTASWTGVLILLVCVAASQGATWISARALGLPTGVWLVAIGATVAAFMTGRGTAGTEARAALRSRASFALRACDEHLRRSRVALLPAGAWTAAVILGVAAWAAPSALWLGSTVIGVPVGFLLVVLGAGIAAYVTRRPAVVEPKSSAPKASAPSAPSTPARTAAAAEERRPVPVAAREVAVAAPVAAPEIPRPERAILDFNPPGPAPRERVPRPKRTKAAPAAAVAVGAERARSPRVASADPPVRKPRRRKTEPAVTRPELPPGTAESAPARRAGRT